ncbi:MAG: hypothetical protein KC503_12105 [Myxococcales bacterium]|nr:hypothetical protein [Myxococcales bacterium]
MKRRILLLAITFTLVAAACSDDSSNNTPDATSADSSAADAGGDSSAAPGLWAVLVRGELAKSDVAQAKADHDAVAAAGETPAKAAGDIGHDALLGTTLLGTTENAFLGIDQWNDAANIEGFYSDPTFQQAFGALFKSPPQPEVFQHAASWHNWGNLAAGDGGDHYFVVVRGRLAESDAAKSQAAHDGIAAAGEPQAKALGDVAHVVFLGLKDPREFFAVDIWTSVDKLEAFYSDPTFQQAFGALFEGQPSVSVYRSTDWHQW